MTFREFSVTQAQRLPLFPAPCSTLTHDRSCRTGHLAAVVQRAGAGVLERSWRGKGGRVRRSDFKGLQDAKLASYLTAERQP